MAGPTDAVAFHAEIAADFHASYDDDPNRRERIVVWRRAIGRYAKPGKLAYDIGCGSGMLTCEIAPYAEQVIAIDGAEPMLNIARQTVAKRGFRHVDFRQMRLPPPSGHGLAHADIVACSSVIEYLPSVDEALGFLANLLNPGGTLFISISNRQSIKRQTVRIINRLTGRPRYFGLLKHFLSAEDLRSSLERVGLKTVHVEYFDGQDRINRLLGMLFPKNRTSNLVFAVAVRSGDVTNTSNHAS
jgi:SAM-dependent methyltransferase